MRLLLTEERLIFTSVPKMGVVWLQF